MDLVGIAPAGSPRDPLLLAGAPPTYAPRCPTDRASRPTAAQRCIRGSDPAHPVTVVAHILAPNGPSTGLEPRFDLEPHGWVRRRTRAAGLLHPLSSSVIITGVRHRTATRLT